MVLITKLDSYAYSTIHWHSYSWCSCALLVLFRIYKSHTFTTRHTNCSSKSIYNKIKREYKLNQILRRPADANKPISFHFTAFAECIKWCCSTVLSFIYGIQFNSFWYYYYYGWLLLLLLCGNTLRNAFWLKFYTWSNVPSVVVVIKTTEKEFSFFE